MSPHFEGGKPVNDPFVFNFFKQLLESFFLLPVFERVVITHCNDPLFGVLPLALKANIHIYM